MITRDKLRVIKANARKPDFQPTTQLVHTLIDHGLAALDELEGGASVIEQRSQLKERERQVKLALADLREQFCLAKLVFPVDFSKALFIMDMIDQMLKAKGPQWHREWSWYRGCVDEEFDK